MKAMLDSQGKPLRNLVYKNNTKWKAKALLQICRYPGNYYVRFTDGTSVVLSTPREYKILKAVEADARANNDGGIGVLIQAEVDRLNAGADPSEVFAKLGELLGTPEGIPIGNPSLQEVCEMPEDGDMDADRFIAELGNNEV
jgi:hypothetical protein